MLKKLKSNNLFTPLSRAISSRATASLRLSWEGECSRLPVDHFFPSAEPKVDHFFPGVGGSIFFWRVDHFFLDDRTGWTYDKIKIS
jgi:hypothetical protein